MDDDAARDHAENSDENDDADDDQDDLEGATAAFGRRRAGSDWLGSDSATHRGAALVAEFRSLVEGCTAGITECHGSPRASARRASIPQEAGGFEVEFEVEHGPKGPSIFEADATLKGRSSTALGGIIPNEGASPGAGPCNRDCCEERAGGEGETPPPQPAGRRRYGTLPTVLLPISHGALALLAGRTKASVPTQAS